MEQKQVFVSVKVAAELLSVSIRTVTYLIARGELKTKRIGRRRLIPAIALSEFARADHLSGRPTLKSADEPSQAGDASEAR
jgi:excisionase family DNA binding protein